MQAKYKEIVERAKRQQATASGRSGENDEKEEPWLRTLLDNIDAAQDYEVAARLSKEDKEEKDRETARRHTQLKDDAMRTLSEKKERQERRDRAEQKRDRGEQSESGDSEESSGKKPRVNVRGLLHEMIQQGAERHREQMEAYKQSHQLLHTDMQQISGTMERSNDLLAQFLQQHRRE